VRVAGIKTKSFERGEKINKLFTGLGSSIGKNCDLGLENAALGLRPRAAFSRPRSQFFTIRTFQPATNTYIYLQAKQRTCREYKDNVIGREITTAGLPTPITCKSGKRRF